jgi:hypothetical protein
MPPLYHEPCINEGLSQDHVGRDRHGGCPNVGHYVRAIPRTGYIAPVYQQADQNVLHKFPWYGGTETSIMHTGQMRHGVFESLTPKGKEICAGLKAPKGALVKSLPIDIAAGLTAGGPGSNTVKLGCDIFCLGH